MNGTHQDPTIYKDPTRWDPGRYAEDRAEDRKKPYAYLGWGAGRHPCRKLEAHSSDGGRKARFLMLTSQLCRNSGNALCQTRAEYYCCLFYHDV